MVELAGSAPSREAFFFLYVLLSTKSWLRHLTLSIHYVSDRSPGLGLSDLRPPRSDQQNYLYLLATPRGSAMSRLCIMDLFHARNGDKASSHHHRSWPFTHDYLTARPPPPVFRCPASSVHHPASIIYPAVQCPPRRRSSCSLLGTAVAGSCVRNLKP